MALLMLREPKEGLAFPGAPVQPRAVRTCGAVRSLRAPKHRGEALEHQTEPGSNLRKPHNNKADDWKRGWNADAERCFTSPWTRTSRGEHAPTPGALGRLDSTISEIFSNMVDSMILDRKPAGNGLFQMPPELEGPPGAALPCRAGGSRTQRCSRPGPGLTLPGRRCPCRTHLGLKS